MGTDCKFFSLQCNDSSHYKLHYCRCLLYTSVPKDHLVFVSMHIPSSSTKELEFNALLPDETSNASSLYDLLKGYKAHLLTGHTLSLIHILG